MLTTRIEIDPRSDWVSFLAPNGDTLFVIPFAGMEQHPHYLHWQADQCEQAGWCYFIGGDVGRIKIGFSVNVAKRLSDFQPGSPIDLRILASAPGGRARERAYHRQFDSFRERGEWFDRHPDILAEISRLNGMT